MHAPRTTPAGHRWLAVLVFLAALLPGVAARAQENVVVTATGMAQITGNNTLAAQQAALRDAMRKAVENGLGMLVESRTLVENYALVNDRIYSRADGFVSSHEVLQEGRDGGNYVVTIRAVVNRQKLGDDARSLGLLQDLVGKPMIMVMVDEYWWDPTLPKASQEPVDDPASASRITERFLNRGFDRMVDAETVKKLRAGEMMALDDLMNDGEALTRIAQQAAADYGAEVLIVGTCKIEPASLVGGKYTAGATLTVKIVNASTGELMGQKQHPQSGVGISPEMARSESGTRAGDAVSDDLINQVLTKWQAIANNGAMYLVKLYEVESYGTQGRKFLEGLKRVGGVTQAKQRAWDAKLKRLEIDLTYKGADVDELTGAIFDALGRDFPNLDLREAKGNNLNFYLTK